MVGVELPPSPPIPVIANVSLTTVAAYRVKKVKTSYVTLHDPYRLINRASIELEGNREGVASLLDQIEEKTTALAAL